MPTILDVNFGREFFGGGAESIATNSPSKFVHQNSLSKFAGNFPKIRQTKIKKSAQITSA